ncbi:MAG: Ig-like domain-containing protein [Candidatus Freyarchaeum deiterrae]
MKSIGRRRRAVKLVILAAMLLIAATLAGVSIQNQNQNTNPIINQNLFLYMNTPANHPIFTKDNPTINYPTNNIVLASGSFNVTWTNTRTDIDYYLVSNDSYSPDSVVNTTTSYQVSLSDGLHTVNVTAVYQDGNSSSSIVSFTVDTTPPTVTITSPSNGTLFNTSSVMVNWTGSDANSGIAYFEVRIDEGSWTNVSASPSYTFTSVTNGTHTVDVVAFDLAGNNATASVSFNVDTIPPTVTITSPTMGVLLNTSSVTVNWTGSDDTGISYYEVRNDSSSWINMGTSTSYTFTSLSDGSHTVYVMAFDLAGNNATTSVSFTVDTTPPTVTITSPSNNAMLNTSSVTVNWTGSDATSGISYFEVRIDGGTWLNASASLSHTFTGVSNGSHTVYVMAFDLAGNNVTASVPFNVDTTPPTVAITSPSLGAVLLTNVVFNWTGSDDTGIAYFEVRIDGGTWLNVSTSLSYTFTGVLNGSHTVYVMAFDLAGNNITASVPFNVDTIPPTVTITSPTNGTLFNTGSVTENWTGSDNTGIAYFEVRNDGGSWINVSKSLSYAFTGLSNGSHSVDVIAFDLAGNNATASVPFTVDTTLPTVTITSPTNGALFNTSSVTVNWTGYAYSGINYYEVKLDGGTFGSVGTNTSYTFTSLSDGSHTVYVRAWSLVGNNATASVSFNVDTIPPTVNIASPTNGALFNTGSVTVNWTGSDANSGIAYFEVRIDGGSWINVSTSLSHTFTGLSTGTHSVDVIAFDLAGNNATASVFFTVDTIPPIVTITSPTNGTLFNTSSVTVNWIGSDGNGTGIAYFEVRIDGGIWINVAKGMSYPFTGLLTGSHPVDVIAFDLAGNNATASVSFNVDTTPPTVTITTPYNDTSINVGTIIIRGVYNGTGSNIQKIDCNDSRFTLQTAPPFGVTGTFVFINKTNPIYSGSFGLRVTVLDDAGFTTFVDRCVIVNQSGIIGSNISDLGIGNNYIDAVSVAGVELWLNVNAPVRVYITCTAANLGGSAPTGFGLLGRFWSISVNDTSAIQSVTIGAIYSDENVTKAGIVAVSGLGYWNDTSGMWEEIPSTLDPPNNIVKATIDHLSSFTILGTLPSSGTPTSPYLPLLLLSQSLTSGVNPLAYLVLALVMVLLVSVVVVAFKGSLRGKAVEPKAPLTLVRSDASKKAGCFYCGSEIPEDAEICPYCGEIRARCSVCNRYLIVGDPFAECPYCGALSHKEHLLQWIGSKGYCPKCKEKLFTSHIKLKDYFEPR